MKSIATKTDTVDTLPANAWNSLSDENQNAVTKSGQTLDATSETTPDPNPTQLARAITKAAQEARAYSDSGAANAYVLTAVGSWQQPTAYTNGMTVEFIGANANTGASTVNVAGLGVKNITTINGSIINSGDIGPTILTRIRYSTSSGSFLLEQVGSSNSEAGGGALNLNINPNANISIDNSGVNDVGDYINSGSGTTASKTITDSEIPLYPRITTGIKITLASGTNDYTRLRFQLPKGYKDRAIGINWVQLTSGLAFEDIKVELYRYSDAYVSGEEEVALIDTDDTSGDTFIQIGNKYFSTSFSPNEYDYYELRWINNGATSGYLSLNEVSVVAQPLVYDTLSGPVTPYTPTFNNMTVSSPNIEYSYDKQMLTMWGFFTLDNNTTGGGNPSFTIPNNFTLDLPGSSTNVLGVLEVEAATTNRYKLLGTNGDNIIEFGRETSSGATVPLTAITGDGALTVTRYSFWFQVPVQELENNYSVTVNQAFRQNAKGAFNSTAGQSIANATWVSLQFATPEKDLLQDQWDGTTFTANRSGFLEGSLSFLWALAFTNKTSTRLFINGSTERRKIDHAPFSSSPISNPYSFSDVYLTAGDTVVFQVFQSEGASRSLDSTAAYNWIDLNWQAEKSGSSIGLPVTGFQIKTVNSNQTSDGVVLTFNNLEIGKSYRLSATLSCITSAAANSVRIQLKHGSNLIDGGRVQESSGTYLNTARLSGEFVATTTTCTLETSSATANSYIQADGVNERSFAMLEELPLVYGPTNKWT